MTSAKLSYMGLYTDVDNRIVRILSPISNVVEPLPTHFQEHIAENITVLFEEGGAILSRNSESDKIYWRKCLLAGGMKKREVSIFLELLNKYNIHSIRDMENLLKSDFKHVMGFGYLYKNAMAFLYVQHYKVPFPNFFKETGEVTRDAICSILLAYGIPFMEAHEWCSSLRVESKMFYIKTLDIDKAREDVKRKYEVKKRKKSKWSSADFSYESDLKTCNYFEIIQKFIR